MSTPSVAIVILAAGASTRMGTSKQLLTIEGKTLLQSTLENALTVTSRVVVVVGAEAEKHAATVSAYTVEVVINSKWITGMGSSIKAGLRTLVVSEDPPHAVMFLVCDQPAVTPAHLMKMVAAFKDSGKPIVASDYSNTVGVPVLFDWFLFEEILKMEDHTGAKPLLKKYADRIFSIPLPGGELDLDTPDAFERYRKGLS